MKRNILLVEPSYKTKFPPMGLMKISTYHKQLGDKVRFVKGISSDAAYDYWDRIYVSTLFTYHWKITIETIKYYKFLVGGDTSRIVVGGIMASLMPDELWRETGVVPKLGVLSAVDVFGDGSPSIVEDMVPDYDLFDESYQNYTLIKDSYFGYSTRGCIHKCKFCGVPKLEPEFIEYKGIKPYIKEIEKQYGEKEHLVLLDNNILASNRFEEIIRDIAELGFGKGSRFGYKDKAGHIIYKQRHVDFNQGTDARLITNKKAKLLATIAMHPLRIAFDSIRFKEIYHKAVLLVADAGIEHLSNYILYNYEDTPEEFWQRLKINIDLNNTKGLKIYSFPMKYIPIKAKDRNYISEPGWNWYFLRNIFRILHVLRGPVATGESFFYRAFGSNEKEFLAILHMPEKILMYRGYEPKQDEKDWLNKFNNIADTEKRDLLTILCENRTKKSLLRAYTQTKSQTLRDILEYYIPAEEDDNRSLFIEEG